MYKLMNVIDQPLDTKFPIAAILKDLSKDCLNSWPLNRVRRIKQENPFYSQQNVHRPEHIDNDKIRESIHESYKLADRFHSAE
jgi:hypothetical protein